MESCEYHVKYHYLPRLSKTEVLQKDFIQIVLILVLSNWSVTNTIDWVTSRTGKEINAGRYFTFEKQILL